MIHPATAHFAIALPVVALVFGLIYMYTKSEGMSKISSRVLLLAAISMIGVWYTGSQAGPEIFDYLSKDGKAVLIAHKELGEYLAIAFGVIAVIKIIGCRLKSFKLEALSILLLLIATATTLYQGKIGGEVTYNHGMPFKAYTLESWLNDAADAANDEEDCDDKVAVYEDAIEDIKYFSEDLNKLYDVSQPKE